VVERLVGWLKEHRRIATRFEKLARGFLAMVKVSFMRRYFRTLERSSDNTWFCSVSKKWLTQSCLMLPYCDIMSAAERGIALEARSRERGHR
jgi:hypothetical protein